MARACAWTALGSYPVCGEIVARKKTLSQHFLRISSVSTIRESFPNDRRRIGESLIGRPSAVWSPSLAKWNARNESACERFADGNRFLYPRGVVVRFAEFASRHETSSTEGWMLVQTSRVKTRLYPPSQRKQPIPIRFLDGSCVDALMCVILFCSIRVEYGTFCTFSTLYTTEAVYPNAVDECEEMLEPAG